MYVRVCVCMREHQSTQTSVRKAARVVVGGVVVVRYGRFGYIIVSKFTINFSLIPPRCRVASWNG